MQRLTLGLLVVFATGFALIATTLDPGQDCLFYDDLDNCIPNNAAESLQHAFIGMAITCAVGALVTLVFLRSQTNPGTPKEPGLLD